MNKDIKENWAKIIDEIGCLKDKPMTRMLLGNLVRKIRREALAQQKQELREKIEKPLGIIEDFIERWNKQDKEKEVAQAIQDINQLLK